jgi:hypothetical protein
MNETHATCDVENTRLRQRASPPLVYVTISPNANETHVIHNVETVRGSTKEPACLMRDVAVNDTYKRGHPWSKLHIVHIAHDMLVIRDVENVMFSQRPSPACIPICHIMIEMHVICDVENGVSMKGIPRL